MLDSTDLRLGILRALTYCFTCTEKSQSSNTHRNLMTCKPLQLLHCELHNHIQSFVFCTCFRYSLLLEACGDYGSRHAPPPQVIAWELFRETRYQGPGEESTKPLSTSPPRLHNPLAAIANMSLNIPNAPNSNLFKQGYQKYASAPGNHATSQLTIRAATTRKMERSSATLKPAAPSPRRCRPPSGLMAATRSSSTTWRK